MNGHKESSKQEKKKEKYNLYCTLEILNILSSAYNCKIILLRDFVVLLSIEMKFVAVFSVHGRLGRHIVELITRVYLQNLIQQS